MSLFDFLKRQPHWKNADWKVRRKAVAVLKDQSVLEQIVRTDEVEWVRIEAIRRIDDPALLFEIAFEDPSDSVRIAVINRIDSQSTLINIAETDRTDEVRVAAVGRIENEAVLAEMAKADEKDQGEKIRMAALQRVEDKIKLADIAETARSDSVRLAAFQRLGKNPKRILLDAIEEDDLDTFRRIMGTSAKQSVDGEVIYTAARTGHRQFVECVLGYGVNINTRCTTEDLAHPSALGLSVVNSDVDAASLLLKMGAGVDEKNDHGATPLYLAVLKQHLDLVGLLARHGADVHAATCGGRTPFKTAEGTIADPLGISGDKSIAEQILCILREGRTDRVPAKSWFLESSQRRGPLSPSDFDLFQVPTYSVENWAIAVAADPCSLYCTIVELRRLGGVTRRLFEALKRKYGLSASSAVDIFDEYVGAACPKCFGGLSGEKLQEIESLMSAKGSVALGGDSGIQRILEGVCPFCPSEEYYVVWLGDKSFA